MHKTFLIQVFLVLAGIGTPAVLFSADNVGTLTYKDACGTRPSLILDHITVQAAVAEKSQREETRGRFAGQSIFEIMLSVHNRGSVPFTYQTYTCSEFDYWKTDNSSIEVYGWPCRSNIRSIRTVEPSQTYTFNLPVAVRNNAQSRMFRMALSAYMTCAELDKRRMDKSLEDLYKSRKEKTSPPPDPKLDLDAIRMIWSNSITLP